MDPRGRDAGKTAHDVMRNRPGLDVANAETRFSNRFEIRWVGVRERGAMVACNVCGVRGRAGQLEPHEKKNTKDHFCAEKIFKVHR